MTSPTPALLARLALLLAVAGTATAASPPGASVMVQTYPGQIFLADRGRIMQLDTVQQKLRPVTADISARGLLLDSDHNVYAASMRYDPRADLYRPTMWRYRPGGSVTETRVAPAAEQFAFSDVADADGNLYFWHVDTERSLSRILIRPRGGEPILLAGHEWGVRDGRGADARFSRLGGMTVGPDGHLYVCDEQCIRRVTRDGHVTTIAQGGLLSLGAGRGTDNHLGALAADRDGNLFVADRVTRRILAVTPGGTVSTLAHAADQWELASLAWSDGGLYVLETGPAGASRVVRVSSEGHRLELPRAAANRDESTPPPVRLSGAAGKDELRTVFLPMFVLPVTSVPWLL